MPAQVTVGPAEFQTEDDAAPSEVAVRHLGDLDGFVSSVHQPVAGQPGAVVLARFVKAPVFGDAQLGVDDPLVDSISPPGRRRRDLKDEVGRLALFRDDVSVVGEVGSRVDVERHQEIRVNHSGHIVALCGGRKGNVAVRSDDGGLGVAEMLCQEVCAAGDGQVLGGGHLLVRGFGRVRELEGGWRFRRFGGGHAETLRDGSANGRQRGGLLAGLYPCRV